MKAHAWETLSLGVWGHCGELWRQVGQSALWRDPSMEMLRVYGGGSEPRGQWMDMVCRVRWWLCRALRGTKVFPCNSEYPFSCYTGFWWQLNNDTQQRHIRPFYLFGLTHPPGGTRRRWESPEAGGKAGEGTAGCGWQGWGSHWTRESKSISAAADWKFKLREISLNFEATGNHLKWENLIEMTLKDTEGGFYRPRLKIMVGERKTNHVSIQWTFQCNHLFTTLSFSLVVMLNEWMDELMNLDLITNCRVKRMFFFFPTFKTKPKPQQADGRSFYFPEDKRTRPQALTLNSGRLYPQKSARGNHILSTKPSTPFSFFKISLKLSKDLVFQQAIWFLRKLMLL